MTSSAEVKLDWLKTPGLLRIFTAIKSGGGEARVVGGAVRAALLGRNVGDIDLATTLPPEKITEILTKAGLKVVPTGIDHGTVTAVADHKGYEITTLRHDVETDGRRAKVAFTDDWQADAARRDFTFNALYADAEGNIYDYVKGREDLTAGHVRFIGDARARITEDVLRILRFFRFHAWFGKTAPDAEALIACKELANLIPTLSAERIWRELTKLLAAPNPLPAWKLMQDTGVLNFTLPEATNLKHLEGLLATEKKYGEENISSQQGPLSPPPLEGGVRGGGPQPTPSLTRLAALLPQDKTQTTQIARRLKLSNKESEKLQTLAELPARLKGKLDPVPFRRALYEHGAENTRNAALLLAAEIPSIDLEPALAEAASWDQPVFPLQGEDILKLGIPPGPKVGEILRAVEQWWIESDFKPPREECLAKAKTLV